MVVLYVVVRVVGLNFSNLRAIIHVWRCNFRRTISGFHDLHMFENFHKRNHLLPSREKTLMVCPRDRIEIG